MSENLLLHWTGKDWPHVEHIIDALGDCVVQGRPNLARSSANYLKETAKCKGLGCRLLGTEEEVFAVVFFREKEES